MGSPAAEIAAALAAFLVGSVPFGWLYGKIVRGVDLRKIGSGNVGATNAARLYRGKRGIPVFILVFLLDCAKGFLAAWPAWGAPALGRALGSTVSLETASVMSGSAAILGHVFTPYLSFRGGKGVATALGVVAALATMPAVYAVGVWGVLVMLTRYVSLGSVVAMLTIPLTYFIENGSSTFSGHVGIFVFLTLSAAVVIWRHRDNIRRLLRGRERKIGQPSAVKAR